MVLLMSKYMQLSSLINVYFFQETAPNRRQIGYVEQVGTYDMMTNSNNEKLIALNLERIQTYIAGGVQVSMHFTVIRSFKFMFVIVFFTREDCEFLVTFNKPALYLAEPSCSNSLKRLFSIAMIQFGLGRYDEKNEVHIHILWIPDAVNRTSFFVFVPHLIHGRLGIQLNKS